MTVTIKRAKTETVSLRLDPKTRFMLEFISRVEGRTITAIVEKAVREAASSVTIGGGFRSSEKSWADFWDSSEGIRTLRLLSEPGYPSDFEEDELRAFTKAHWEFFYTSPEAKFLQRHYVEVLWPKAQEYLQTWKATQRTNYWAAGEAMAADLSSARLDAPLWPRSSTKTKGVASIDDDEIPF